MSTRLREALPLIVLSTAVIIAAIVTVPLFVGSEQLDAQDTTSNETTLETTTASIATVSDTAELVGELRYQDAVDFVHRVDPVEVIVETEVPIAPTPAPTTAAAATDSAAGIGRTDAANTAAAAAAVQIPQTETVETTTLEEDFRTITGLPTRGQTIQFGEVLYETDSTPVILAPGDVAAWRTMTIGTSGEDVAQLQSFLVAGGFADATLANDGVWGTDTTNAVQVWQEETGQAVTSSVALGDIWFASTPVRITEVAATVGIVVGNDETVFRYTSTDRAVEATVTELPEGLLDADELTARLPDGSTTEATLRSVRGTDEGFDLIVDIDLFSTDIADVNGLDITTSWVTSELVDALTLPPEAIRRLDDGRYVVDVLDGDETRTVPVDVLGQAGRVVAVAGISEADLVVVP